MLAVCLVSMLFLEPVKDTLAYVTSSPVTVVNTFEGETEEPTEPVEPEKPGGSEESKEQEKTSETETSAGTMTSSETEASSEATEQSNAVEAAAPQTGDDSHIVLYALAGLIGLAVIIILLFKLCRGSRRKGKRKN